MVRVAPSPQTNWTTKPSWRSRPRPWSPHGVGARRRPSSTGPCRRTPRASAGGSRTCWAAQPVEWWRTWWGAPRVHPVEHCANQLSQNLNKHSGNRPDESAPPRVVHVWIKAEDWRAWFAAITVRPQEESSLGSLAIVRACSGAVRSKASSRMTARSGRSISTSSAYRYRTMTPALSSTADATALLAARGPAGRWSSISRIISRQWSGDGWRRMIAAWLPSDTLARSGHPAQSPPRRAYGPYRGTTV